MLVAGSESPAAHGDRASTVRGFVLYLGGISWPTAGAPGLRYSMTVTSPCSTS